MKRFEGSYAVCVTPFTEDGSDVNYSGLKHYINWQIASGSPGLIFLGSTGEFLSVSDEERIGITETAVKTAAGRIPILMGTAAEDTREAARLSRQAEALGADGLMIIPPYLADPEEVRPYFRRLRELRDQLAARDFPGVQLGELSMGMSHDFAAAIKEGATMIRVGTAIFGSRTTPG